MTKQASVAFIALPMALLLLAACGGDDGGDAATEHGGHEMASEVAAGAREITVDADSFEFTPSDLTVTAGEDIAILLSSDDVYHDFEVDGVEGHVGAEPGEAMTGGFRFDEPGEYTYFCSVAGHRAQGMEGTITVE
jgi:cytochrome c oxidase subunit II